ncbi:MAG TPA: hypothetical protein VK203_17785 [Nostocaceae cyanobacterium]|nr:hypothetical protein [Nostocaceae cyanobacterium]
MSQNTIKWQWALPEVDQWRSLHPHKFLTERSLSYHRLHKALRLQIL